MEVEYSLTPEDIAAFARYHVRHPPTARGRSGLRSPWLTAALAVLVSGLVVFNDLQGGRLSLFAYFFGALAVLCVGLAVMRPWLVTRSVTRALLEEGNRQKLLAAQRIVLTPEGFGYSSEFEVGVTRWQAIEKIAVTPDHAFLYTSHFQAHVVPRHAFASEREFQVFVEAARDYHRAAADA